MKIDIEIVSDVGEGSYEFGWPYIQDPVGSSRSLEIEFFDAATKRVSIPFVSYSVNTIIFDQDLRDIFRQRQPVIITYSNESGSAEATWFVTGSNWSVDNQQTSTILTSDPTVSLPPAHLPIGISKVEVWTDVEWGSSATLTNVFSDDAPLLDHLPWMSKATEIHTRIYSSTDSRVPQTCIDREFGDDDSVRDHRDRWDRKPITNLWNTRADFQQFIPRQLDSDSSSGGVGDGARWLLSTGFFNLLFETKNEETTKFRAAPSDFVFYSSDPYGELRKTSSFKRKDGIDIPYNLQKKGVPNPKVDIAVSEMGSKSLGHYLNTEPVLVNIGTEENPNYEQSYTLGLYGYEYITKRDNVQADGSPANLFFNCFNTADRDNFKITTEPRYNADEYSGKPISLNSKTKVGIYLVPRRAAYTTRARRSEQELYNLSQVVNCISECGNQTGPVEEMCQPPAEYRPAYDAYRMDQGYHDETYKEQKDCYALLSDMQTGGPPMYGVNVSQYPINCSGCSCNAGYDGIDFTIGISCFKCGEWTLLPHGYFEMSIFLNTVFTDSSIPSTINESGVASINLCHPSWSQFSADCNILTQNWGINVEIIKVTQTHTYGIWWDRLPSDLGVFKSASSLTQGTDIATVDYSGGESPIVFMNRHTSEPIYLRGDEHWDAAITEFGNANSGNSSFHYFIQAESSQDSFSPHFEVDKFLVQFTSFGQIPIGTICNLTEIGQHLAGQWRTDTGYDDPTIDPEEKKYSQPLQRFWEKIQGNTTLGVNESWFWTNHSDVGGGWSRQDNIPFGVAISPTQAGDLVGIIKMGAKSFFVWRKTNETFDFSFHAREGGYGGQNTTFEGSGDNTNPQIIFPDANGGDTYYLDQFIASRYREVTQVGRKILVTGGSHVPENICSQYWATLQVVNFDTSEAYTLPAPIYIICSREWALKDYPRYSGNGRDTRDLQPNRFLRTLMFPWRHSENNAGHAPTGTDESHPVYDPISMRMRNSY